MKFEREVKEKQYAALWAEYCGFLDLDMEGLYAYPEPADGGADLAVEPVRPGRKDSGWEQAATIEEFRRTVPLTTYEDYADILLLKQGDMLPDTPIIWIQTTWEGGRPSHQGGALHPGHAGDLPQQYPGLSPPLHQP